MDRIDRLRGPADHAIRLLEIGPSHSPIAPKNAGWNTHIVDHGTQDELRTKYAAMGIDTKAIEVIDTVWRGGALHEAVPESLHGKFQRAIASHVIEHIPDVAGFLISLERLLDPDGTVALAIPDRRYCFDYFKPHPTTGDVLEAHATRRSRHSRRTIWNMGAYTINMDGAGAWGQFPVHEPTFMAPFNEAAAAQRDFHDDIDAPYADSHAWHFTPASFSLMILELGYLGVVDWHIDTLHGPEGCEFFAFLKRGAERVASESVLQSRRMMLLREHLVELHEQIQFATTGRLMPRTLMGSDVQRTIVDDGTKRLLERLNTLDERTTRLEGLDGKLEGISATLQKVESQLAPVAPVFMRVGQILRTLRALWRRVHPVPRA